MPADDQIRIIVSGLERDVEQVVKKLALDAVANLVRAASEGGTPVDTGWARANWLANIGTPITEPVGTNKTVNAAEAAQQAGLGGVLKYKLAFGPVYISNNVPYILRLNEGSSKKAAAGFVQRAIQLAVTQVGLTAA